MFPNLGRNIQIIAEIAKGGMAVVYKANWLVPKGRSSLVAIKTIQEENKKNPEYIRRFKEEVNILEKLSHPSIIPIISSGVTTEGVPFFVMEYVNGAKNLEEIKNTYLLNVNKCLELNSQILDVIEYLHLNNINHADISPTNILQGLNGKCFLIDFGISREIDTDHLTKTRMGFSKPFFTHPQVSLGGVRSKCHDYYSLAATLFYLYFGSFLRSDDIRLFGVQGVLKKIDSFLFTEAIANLLIKSKIEDYFNPHLIDFNKEIILKELNPEDPALTNFSSIDSKSNALQNNSKSLKYSYFDRYFISPILVLFDFFASNLFTSTLLLFVGLFAPLFFNEKQNTNPNPNYEHSVDVESSIVIPDDYLKNPLKIGLDIPSSILKTSDFSKVPDDFESGFMKLAFNAFGYSFDENSHEYYFKFKISDSTDEDNVFFSKLDYLNNEFLKCRVESTYKVDENRVVVLTSCRQPEFYNLSEGVAAFTVLRRSSVFESNYNLILTRRFYSMSGSNGQFVRQSLFEIDSNRVGLFLHGSSMNHGHVVDSYRFFTIDENFDVSEIIELSPTSNFGYCGNFNEVISDGYPKCTREEVLIKVHLAMKDSISHLLIKEINRKQIYGEKISIHNFDSDIPL